MYVVPNLIGESTVDHPNDGAGPEREIAKTWGFIRLGAVYRERPKGKSCLPAHPLLNAVAIVRCVVESTIPLD